MRQCESRLSRARRDDFSSSAIDGLVGFDEVNDCESESPVEGVSWQRMIKGVIQKALACTTLLL